MRDSQTVELSAVTVRCIRVRGTRPTDGKAYLAWQRVAYVWSPGGDEGAGLTRVLWQGARACSRRRRRFEFSVRGTGRGCTRV